MVVNLPVRSWKRSSNTKSWASASAKCLLPRLSKDFFQVRTDGRGRNMEHTLSIFRGMQLLRPGERVPPRWCCGRCRLPGSLEEGPVAELGCRPTASAFLQPAAQLWSPWRTRE